ncbi:insulinase family metalloproteinase, partial [Chlamydia psittaci 84-8471/1]
NGYITSPSLICVQNNN